MNYGALKSAVLARAHRTDLASEVAGFVAGCEGMIATDLRAREMILRTTLVEADRVVDGIYKLPANFLEERVLRIGTNPPLDKKGVRELNDYGTAGDVVAYTILGGDDPTTAYGGEIEFRAVPGTNAEIELIYFGYTRFADDADLHPLLTNQQELYLQGSLLFLRQHTEEFDLADAHSNAFDAIAARLNRQASRYFGGTSSAAPYNLGNFKVGRGY